MREAIRTTRWYARCTSDVSSKQSLSETGASKMSNTNTQIELSMDQLATVGGGFKIPGWLKTAGQIAAPALIANPITAPLGIAAANKKALVHGGIWAGGGAVAGSPGGPEGAAAGAAGGFLAG